MKRITFWLFALFFISLSYYSQAQNVVINELLASNNVSIQDEDSTHQDWIELYNSGATTVNLLGYGLTDDALLLYKWTFPNVSIAPGQYLIIWASDKNRTVVGNPLHTNFKISASGENILLTNTFGVTIDTMPPANLQADISYGRFPNGTGPFVFFGTPTPNLVNATAGFSEALNPPVFSQNSAFLTTGFNLSITSPDSGTTILYTVDGSEPDENNLSGTTYNYKNQYPRLPGQAFGTFLFNSFQTLQYTTPITIVDKSPQPNKVSAISTTYDFVPPYIPSGPIFKGNVIRAKVIKPGALSSKVVTKNYFITPLGPNKFTLPVISLSIDENKLYDYEDGISVAGIDFDNWRIANPTRVPSRQIGNYERSGIANERKANMQYFVGGLEKINQDVGIRIRGAFSRVYPSKSWNIAARSDFGDDNLSYKFFTDEPYTSFERVSIKSGGSDFYNTMFRDALNHQLVKDLRMETESFQPMVVFMNGEYWGLLNMREKYDNNYFKQVYNIDEVDLLENQGAIQEGDDVDYNNMYTYIENNSFVSDANFNFIKTRLDPDNFTDYFVSNIFFQNDDWPGNNIVYWRKKTTTYEPTAPYGSDGRWRWALHDNDSTFDESDYDSLAAATSTTGVSPNPPWSTLILRKLLENNTFKIDFINRFADLMNTNFLPSRIISKIDEISAIIAPEMNDQYFRWKAPLNNSDWQFHLNEEKNFANERPAFQRDHIRAKFGITSNINATLNVSNIDHGYVKMNTIDVVDGTPGIIGNPYPWTGIYFKDIPVKLKAIAKPGFIFSNWTGASNSTSAEITLAPTANFSITAVFIPDGIVDVSVPIYFWMMDTGIVNGAQLTSLNTTFELTTNGVIQYQSCLVGYPFSSGPNVGKASMERRNLPINLNYRQSVNGNIPFATSNMRGLQIKQPFQSGGLENTMIYNFSTTGYKKIKFSFAGIDEGAANAITIDYSINSGSPIWITTGLTSTSLPLTASYQLFEVDFSTITTVDNNSNFKIRFRFTGPNMTADLGNRVTFNNIAVDGVKIPLSYPSPNVFTIGTAISNLNPSSTQIITNYTVNPSLPNGLILNSTTGIISGTPTQVSTIGTYVVTGTYASGTIPFDLVITVNDIAPSSLSYNTPNVFTKNTGISSLFPTSSGGAILSYSISPSLPTGLNLNTTTGEISGTPTIVSATATYTVTALNSGGSTTFGIVITVNDQAPNTLSYTSPNVFTKNTGISSLIPTSSGGTILSYSISPSLPTGLNFNITTGEISGTPTLVTATATYTVTALNSGGSTTFGVVITVNDQAPNTLSYTSPNVFTKNTGISSLIPTSSGGVVLSYSISPSLPTGLNFNTTTGVISGTPTLVSATATYTVTALNSGGSTNFGVVITVNDIAPSSLSYNTPNVFTKNTGISSLIPTSSGGAILSYSISPSLPTGLNFNTTTGVISGTPTLVSATATYTVTALNSGGSTNFGVVITVNDIAPSSLSYNTPNVFTKNTGISSLIPTSSGGVVLSYSISPSLPTGLNFNTTTGVISGTPTLVTATATYTVTALNSGGSTTFGVVITVNDQAPNTLSYTSPNVFIKNTGISSLIPTSSGGAILSYSISPSLPTGLNFNTTTGVISGTPTLVTATATYTVTALNSGGSTTFGVVITVNDQAPNTLSYTSPNVFIKNTGISSLIPTSSGGVVLSYSISPSLPTGLNFNTTTGEISGIPTLVSATATYTVTALNSGGSTTFGVVITVNDQAPNALSYTSPNVFTNGSLISSLFPSISGTVLSYSISPSLPTGLNFNTTTGVISGTPTLVTATATYTVTALNSGGSTTFGVVITVNDQAPNTLSYTSPNVFTSGSLISSLFPSISGTVLSYSISPSLPTGLNFNTTTGEISGTPTLVTATATYTVTALNSGGSTTFGVVITVNDQAPNALSYTSPNVFTKNTGISSLIPTSSGGVVLSYSISPSLPTGLNFNTTTGVISGTPTLVTATATYTVTALNSGGSTTFGVVITVNDQAPNTLSYTSPNVFTSGSLISSLFPSISGTVLSYSISPSLPTGLNFNTTTGVISGTPTLVTATATYTVTALNSGGSTTFGVVITVNDQAPNALSYTSPNVFTNGSLISSLFPSISGTVLSYSISPSLPTGLNFNTTTGVISGTPTLVTATATYTVTALNSGGSTTFGVVITVNDQAPNTLSYTSPNVFTSGSLISSLFPSISGTVLSYSISPSLPTGLNLNTTTGEISGTPTLVSAMATYTVTALNSGGSTTFGVVITVNDQAPNTLSYTSPNVFTNGSLISSLFPSISGTVLSYSISPSLPTGLNLNTTTGEISGTPTIVSATATYTVTALNSGGSTTFGVVITVNDQAPNALSYTSPNVFTNGSLISSLFPSISGTVLSYSISPSLPTGLNLNTTTGEISGTPTIVTATATYTVTALNSGGSTTFGVVITVNDQAPNTLSYTSPNVFTNGSLISSLFPSISGTVLSYSISPSLPTGLNFNTTTGEISGTPTLVSATATYTVTALNSGGSTTFGIVITVNDQAPNALSYTSPNVFTKNTVISSLIPTISGGAALSYSISPSLPTGLNLNTTTGEISGTPTLVTATATYTVTALNSGGSTTFGVVITVNDQAPNTLSYTSPNVFTKNTGISSLIPTSSGGVVLSYSISPSLPTGLNLNTTTGEISGTPTLVSATATYTVTALNSGGSTTFGVVITVNDQAPNALSYTSPNVFTSGSLISSLFPSISGTVLSYSISPSLPTGLNLNTTTGEISGTPTLVTATATYTVTALNSGGSTTFGVVITVNDQAPNTLSYTSPNVFTKNTGISSLIPTSSGGAILSYSISPSLPTGLNFNTTTGEISGTPTLVSATATYTVTALNSGGSTNFGVVITVNDQAPNTLSYTSPNVFTNGSLISSLFPSISGTVLSYSISPSLPTGLNLNTTTGEISGTPTLVTATATYTVTALNSGGSTTFGVVITVNDQAPNTLSYTSPNVFTNGSLISSLFPSISGTVLSYTISPSLPTGLNFNTTTGEISGTPTLVSATATYTVTALNSGGSTTFGVVITVNDQAPNALSYTSPNVFTNGSLISSLFPSISGTVLSYSISPSLPTGLNFNTTTGVISGTPTLVTATATYTVTALNSGGSTTFGVVITVNDQAPNTLSYTSPNVFTSGSLISSLFPSISGTVLSYSISPSLPTGLNFNTTTGEISGTPTLVTATATYTVTALNSGGSTTFGVVITVNDQAPNALSYTSPNVFTKNTGISSLIPTSSGGVVLSYSISPSLPTGLNFNTTTGVISGTPTLVSATATYTVTALNSGGSTTFGVVITVNDQAPNTLSYTSPNVFTNGSLISSLFPSISGTVLSYSISPSLPTGLNFNTTTGVISGTPTLVTATATYTVTALNSGGSTTFGVVITVNDQAPNALSYTSPNVFTNGSLISSLFPSISGTVLSYSISPSLPTGLNFNTTTGEISGTPTLVTATATYTVTALNSGGSTTFGVVITVNDQAPNSLSYTSPNVFTSGSLISSLFPSISGTVLSYSISPSLPTGLNFNTTTGEISGTPTLVTATATYSVTALNSGGSTTFGVVITVNDQAPNTLSYTSPNVFTNGSLISSLFPSISGTVLSYSISPSLPTGLNFNTTTGVISGTPTLVTATATYTVTALNSGGSTTFGVVITIEENLNLEDYNFSGFTIYPNPFEHIITISGIINEATYKMYAIDGKLIQKGHVIDSTIDFRDLPNGVYLLNLFSNGKTETKKIIKK